MTKPTDDELRITRETLEFLEENLLTFEPYAVDTINAYREALQSIPTFSRDIEE